MTGLVRKATLLTACGLLAAASAFANVPNPANCTVPCAIVLVGNNLGATVADPYGTFSVVVRDAVNSPVAGCTVTVDFSGCCPGIKLSNTQLGVGVSHAANSALVTGTTDATGSVTFTIEGAAEANASFISGPNGCASITATPVSSAPVLLTDGIAHKTVLVAVPDLDGAGGGGAGVGVSDLAFFITDKNAFAANSANYRQRSDFDFHLPVFACAAAPTGGNGVTVADLGQWVSIKNSLNSQSNGAFPANCP